MKRSVVIYISSELCYPIYKIWKACKDYKLINDKLNSLNSQVHIECIQWYESHRTKLAKLNKWNSSYKKREDRPLICKYCMHIKHKKLRFSKLTTKCTKFTANFIAQIYFFYNSTASQSLDEVWWKSDLTAIFSNSYNKRESSVTVSHEISVSESWLNG